MNGSPVPADARNESLRGWWGLPTDPGGNGMRQKESNLCPHATEKERGVAS
jgi:hypothetical protein